MMLLTYIASVAETPKDLFVWSVILLVGLGVALWWYSESERSSFERIDATFAAGGYGSGGSGGSRDSGGGGGHNDVGHSNEAGDEGEVEQMHWQEQARAAAATATLEKKPSRMLAVGKDFARNRDGRGDKHSEGNIFITNTEL